MTSSYYGTSPHTNSRAFFPGFCSPVLEPQDENMKEEDMPSFSLNNSHTTNGHKNAQSMMLSPPPSNSASSTSLYNKGNTDNGNATRHHHNHQANSNNNHNNNNSVQNWDANGCLSNGNTRIGGASAPQFDLLAEAAQRAEMSLLAGQMQEL